MTSRLRLCISNRVQPSTTMQKAYQVYWEISPQMKCLLWKQPLVTRESILREALILILHWVGIGETLLRVSSVTSLQARTTPSQCFGKSVMPALWSKSLFIATSSTPTATPPEQCLWSLMSVQGRATLPGNRIWLWLVSALHRQISRPRLMESIALWPDTAVTLSPATSKQPHNLP